MGEHPPFSPNRGRPARTERRISKSGKVHFVSAARQRRRQLVALLGYRPRRTAKQPRVTKGRSRRLTVVEEVRIRAESAQGVSAQRIGRRLGRDRRTVATDRVLTDARGLRLAGRLAADRSLWVLLPDVLETLRGGAALAPVLQALVTRLQDQPSSGVNEVVRTRALAAVRRFQARCTPAAPVVWGPAYVTPPMA
jgi:hypothetical protein